MALVRKRQGLNSVRQDVAGPWQGASPPPGFLPWVNESRRHSEVSWEKGGESRLHGGFLAACSERDGQPIDRCICGSKDIHATDGSPETPVGAWPSMQRAEWITSRLVLTMQ